MCTPLICIGFGAAALLCTLYRHLFSKHYRTELIDDSVVLSSSHLMTEYSISLEANLILLSSSGILLFTTAGQ